MMLLLGVLIAAGASTISDDAIRLHASRCGLKPNQLVWTTDAAGRLRADITANGNLPSLSFKSMSCFLNWAEQSGVRIGFISEPAPSAPAVKGPTIPKEEW
jgi:hypothetical protein